MKFTVSWLKKYVDIDLPVADIADRLTMLGLEVDAVEELFSGLDNVIVAKVEKVEKHPNADKLSLCDVFTGTETTKIVCGAPNVRSGMVVALALPGAVLPGGFKVKPAKIRGEKSYGMLCSAKELQISDDHEGIMDLDQDLQIGRSVVEALELADTLIEVDLTPNRPDCTSVIGVAREIAGFTASSLQKPEVDLPALEGCDSFAVEVEAPKECPRYAARLLKNVTVAPSPWWLQKLLLAVGLRPINNVVDITNFVMLEYGQPLHAFDFDQLNGSKIIVRKAKENEQIVTLDGVKRDLDEEMLLICDAEKPVAVAGVMGGENSEVSDATNEVLLESAYFNPISIRRTNRQLNLGTDASYRFERGIDPQGTIKALDRAADLLCQICGAHIVDSGIDACTELESPASIEFRVQRVSDILGVRFTAKQLHDYLNAIEIDANIKDDDTLEVTPPSFRVDLEREIDLVEEIARLYGYNEIPTSLPVVPMSFSEEDNNRKMRSSVTAFMTAMGYDEAINYSFTTKKHFDMLGLDENDTLRRTVNILNPLTEDQGVMRTSLLPGLLENVKHNINRQNVDVRLFEVGKVFHPVETDDLADEVLHLTAVLTGRLHPGSSLLYFGEEHSALSDAKGVVDQLLKELHFGHPVIASETNPAYSDAGYHLAVKCSGVTIGELGKFDPKVLKKFGIKQDVFFVDLNISKMLSLTPEPIVFTPLSKFPAVKWDVAIIVPETVGAGDIIQEIMGSKKSYLENAEIFDIYRGEPIKKGHKSVAIKITYHSKDQTLDDDTVGHVHQQIIDLLLSRFDGQLREI